MTDRYQGLRDAIAAGPVQLPEWFDCKAAVERGDATALQRFIYEYDEAVPERSKAFFARLRAVLDEARPDPDTIAALLADNDKLREALAAIVYWHDEGRSIDESWWEAARAALADGEASKS